MGNSSLILATPFIMAGAILAYVAYQYRRGEVLDRDWRWVARSKSPSVFWLIIVGQIFMAVAVAVAGSAVLQP